MNTIKPIETQYNGYRFRSRLEARWAVFFDALEIGWEYEKEGYDLGEAGWYLPDFWIPAPGFLIPAPERYGDKGFWLEVKGESPSETELHKAKMLAVGTGNPVGIVTGMPHEHYARFYFRDGDEIASWMGLVRVLTTYGLSKEWIMLNMDIAKASRFEYGEHGA